MSDIRSYLNSDRRDFKNINLDDKGLAEQPSEQFGLWLKQAIQDEVKEPYAMCLSTLGLDAMPQSRILFLRDFSEEGLIFYTNYGSQKGQELAANPRAAMNFHWAEQDRQVRVSGLVEKVSKEVSDAYYASRPRGSQIGAWASRQSEILPSRGELEAQIKLLEEKYEGQDVPRPEHWGGYILKAERWEFWQGRSSRLHDRVRYTQNGGTWSRTRLNP